MFRIAATAMTVLLGVEARTQHFNLAKERTVRRLENRGITVKNNDIVLDLDQALCSGYSCQYKATPEHCVELVDADGDEFTPTSTSYKLVEGVQTMKGQRDDCDLDIAMVRIWDFDGWNDDGSLVNESQASATYHIPIKSSNDRFRK